MHPISTPDAAAPLGHYAQAIAHNGLIFVSTQLPIAPGSSSSDPALPAGAQAELALRNVLAIVRAAGGSPASILRITIYLADIAAWAEVNAAYARVMESAKPARGVIQVAGLHNGVKVAIDAVAAAG